MYEIRQESWRDGKLIASIRRARRPDLYDASEIALKRSRGLVGYTFAVHCPGGETMSFKGGREL